MGGAVGGCGAKEVVGSTTNTLGVVVGCPVSVGSLVVGVSVAMMEGDFVGTGIIIGELVGDTTGAEVVGAVVTGAVVIVTGAIVDGTTTGAVDGAPVGSFDGSIVGTPDGSTTTGLLVGTTPISIA